MAAGVNLAEEFPHNPFCEAFAKVDAQWPPSRLTKPSKSRNLPQPGAKENIEAVATQTEKEREPLAAAIKEAFVPVTHTIRIEPQ